MSAVSRLHLKIIAIDVPAKIISERTGIPTSRLSEYRHMRRKIPMGHVIVLCEVLNCDPDEIVGAVETDEIAFR